MRTLLLTSHASTASAPCPSSADVSRVSTAAWVQARTQQASVPSCKRGTSAAAHHSTQRSARSVLAAVGWCAARRRPPCPCSAAHPVVAWRPARHVARRWGCPLCSGQRGMPCPAQRSTSRPWSHTRAGMLARRCTRRARNRGQARPLHSSTHTHHQQLVLQQLLDLGRRCGRLCCVGGVHHVHDRLALLIVAGPYGRHAAAKLPVRTRRARVRPCAL